LSSEHEFEIKEKLNAPEIKNILNILVGWFRDVYLYKIGTKLEELINIDRKIELSHLSKKYTFEQLDSILNSISRGVAYLDYNINPKLLLANLRAELWIN
jgi:hypothetical protein